MKALDTNCLVRFLVRDDDKQAQVVRKVLLEEEKKGNTVFVSAVVLLETVWVLGSVYDYSKTEIKRALEHLILLPVFEFEVHDRILALCRTADKSPLDLADIFIGLTSRDRGCETTLTFDRGASKSDLFTLLA